MKSVHRCNVVQTVDDIVKAHVGVITVETKVDEGTALIIVLPD